MSTLGFHRQVGPEDFYAHGFPPFGPLCQQIWSAKSNRHPQIKWLGLAHVYQCVRLCTLHSLLGHLKRERFPKRKSKSKRGRGSIYILPEGGMLLLQSIRGNRCIIQTDCKDVVDTMKNDGFSVTAATVIYDDHH